MKKNNKKINPKNLLEIVIQSLEKDKAIDIKSIDLISRSSFADFMIVASGNSSRQVKSMSENLTKKLKDIGISIRKPEGLINADWVLIDIDDVVVHLFRPEVREFYKLEKMWEITNLKNSKETQFLK